MNKIYSDCLAEKLYRCSVYLCNKKHAFKLTDTLSWVPKSQPAWAPSVGYTCAPSEGHTCAPSEGYTCVPSEGYTCAPSKGCIHARLLKAAHARLRRSLHWTHLTPLMKIDHGTNVRMNVRASPCFRRPRKRALYSFQRLHVHASPCFRRLRKRDLYSFQRLHVHASPCFRRLRKHALYSFQRLSTRATASETTLARSCFWDCSCALCHRLYSSLRPKTEQASLRQSLHWRIPRFVYLLRMRALICARS